MKVWKKKDQAIQKNQMSWMSLINLENQNHLMNPTLLNNNTFNGQMIHQFNGHSKTSHTTSIQYFNHV